MKLSQWFSMPNPDGSRRLKKDAAKACNVSNGMISEYIAETAWPTRDTAIKLRAHTNGEWTPNDQLPPFEPRRKQRAQFASTSNGARA